MTDGVSIKPSPRPISNRPGANAQALGAVPVTMARQHADPPIVTTKPADDQRPLRRSRLASRSAASDATSRPSVSAVKMTPVWMAS